MILPCSDAYFLGTFQACGFWQFSSLEEDHTQRLGVEYIHRLLFSKKSYQKATVS